MRRAVVLVAAMALGSACAPPPQGARPSPSDAASASPVVSNPPLETIELTFPGGHVATAEVADDHTERLLGLMNRRELGRDDGMLFLFPAKSSGGFWMKNTLIPLQIAYLGRDRDGFEVLALVDMVPCERDPCPDYPPGVQYDAALEMNAGWFDDAGAEVGDTATASEAL